MFRALAVSVLVTVACVGGSAIVGEVHGGAATLPHPSTSPLTEAFIDTEANFDGEPVSTFSGAASDPSQFAGSQFQTSNVEVAGDPSPTSLTLVAIGSRGNNYSIQLGSLVPFAPGMHTVVPPDSGDPVLSVDHYDDGCGDGGSHRDRSDQHR
jgi:hypothetical protein